MITCIKVVTVYVENQQSALEFYTEKLGFEIRRQQPMGPQSHWIEVAPPGAETTITLYPKAMMPDWSSRKLTLIFRCENTEATHKELAARGVTFTQEPQKMPWGVMAQFVDPDGNSFTLVQD